MKTDILRAELERLFELDELLRLSREVLGFEPEEIGGTAARGSFAGALTEYCVQADAVEALCDAMLSSKHDVDPGLQELGLAGLQLDEELSVGTSFGPYTLTKRLGEGRLGVCYLAEQGTSTLRVKVLRQEATRDRRGLHRFLTLTRLVGRIEHQGLARLAYAGKIGDRYAVAHDFVEGQALSERLSRTGSMHMTEVVPLVRTALRTLKALHDRRIAHGDLRPENFIVCQKGEGLAHAVLLDAGSDRLRARARVGNGRTELFSTVGSPRSVAPEQIRGITGDRRSDLYSFGALLFEMLTGKPPFDQGNALDLAFDHLSKKPPVPSTLAPRGWVPEAIDQLILALLRKDPAERPQTIDKVLASFETGSLRPPAPLEEDALQRRMAALLADPADLDLAVRLEELVDRGAGATIVADALLQAAEYLDTRIADSEAQGRAEARSDDFLGAGDFEIAQEVTGVVSSQTIGFGDAPEDLVEPDDWEIDEDSSPPTSRKSSATLRTRNVAELKTARAGLLFRAARLYARSDTGFAQAEHVYERLVEIDPGDAAASNALEDVRRRLGKFDAIIETLLHRSESVSTAADRARCLAEIGRVYAVDLHEPDQAAVAYTQALCEDPSTEDYAREVERLATQHPASWNDVLGACGATCADAETLAENRVALSNHMGHWYADLLRRPDLALPCYQAVLAADPGNETALAGLSEIYRDAQAFSELATLLLQRADAAPSPARARDLRAEAGRVLAGQLNAAPRAIELFESVVHDDPNHRDATSALLELYEQAGNHAAMVRLLEAQAQTQTGAVRYDAACRVAEMYADRLGKPDDAIKHYEHVLRENPNHLAALRGLDKIFCALGRFRDVLDILERQIELAATSRQKIGLWQRVAGIQDEEFTSHVRAAEAWEAVLDLDPANELALRELVRHYRALDRWDDVEQLYGRHLKLVTEPARRFELTLARAQVLDEQLGAQERAIEAFEAALGLYPEHPGALEALSRLRQASGDADAALTMIEQLARKATTHEGRAEQYLKAARLLERRGDREGAINAFKRALDSAPGDVAASTGLREAYLAGGDVNAALQLLERDAERTEGERAKAKILGEIALLLRNRLGDSPRAEDAARRAIKLDPTNLDALSVLGDIAFENGRFVEAITAYESLVERAESMDKPEATQLLVRYVDALCQSGSVERTPSAIELLHKIAGDDPDASRRVADLIFAFGEPRHAAELYRDYLDRFDQHLAALERAQAFHRYGESLLKSGQADAAVEPLHRALDLDDTNILPLATLAEAYSALGEWEEVIRLKNRQLDVADEDDRERILVEIGDIATDKLGDRTRAANCFVAALEMRPDDRRILTKLMQLYGEEKDWGKLVDVVLRLAEFVIEPDQKAKYLHTAAKVTARQLNDIEQALQYYEQVLTLSPGLDRAFDEMAELERDRGNLRGLERVLRRKLYAAQQAGHTNSTFPIFDELGDVYRRGLGLTDSAIEAYEAAQALDPGNRERANVLSELYASDPGRYLDRAVTAQEIVLGDNPYRAESYKLLRRLYTDARDADASWCLCQTLSVLNIAEPDEDRFYLRMRAETAAPAQSIVSEEAWSKALIHPFVDPLLTTVFALIESAVVAKRGESFEQAGYYAPYALDLANHYSPVSQSLYYAAGVLGVPAPLCFENPELSGGLHFLHTLEPSIVLGRAALSPEVPPQAAAYIAARHLAYFRPGMYLRQLLPSGTGLKSWLFAAIKLVSPQFPVSPDLEGSVREAVLALDTGLQGQVRDHLTGAVSRLLQSSSALDLRRWVAGVDLTADRVGLLISHDLRTTFDLVKATPEDGTLAASNEQRIRELALFSVSAQYFGLRRSLAIRIDS